MNDNDKVNYYDLILSIKVDVATVKTDVKNMKDAPRNALEAKQIARQALDTVKEHDEQREKQTQIKLAVYSMMSALIGAVISILPSVL